LKIFEYFFSSLPTSGEYYVRECYKALGNFKFGAKMGERLFLGTPGIGKSLLAFYICFRLLSKYKGNHKNLV
jgi:DNA replication protein DnaC